jgi:predicted nucleotidyltransferase
MAASLRLLADQLGVHERTLRRAAADGAIRGRRLGPRRLVLTPVEERYVLHAWPLLGRLRALLRLERNVRLAVLFGSRARGDERPDSDVDLLVELVDARASRRLALASRLESALGLGVELVPLTAAERSPLLLADVIEDGRAIVDRDGRLPDLQRRRPEIARAAAAADTDLRAAAAAAIAELSAPGDS